MRYAVIISCLAVFFAEPPRLQPSKPIVAEFLPFEVRDHFRVSKGVQYWGAESSGWHLAFRDPIAKKKYLVDGGYGEFVRFEVLAFTSDPNFNHWTNWPSMRVRLTVQAPGVKDFVQTTTAWSKGFRGNTDGSGWILLIELSLQELRQYWGRLPSEVLLVATLDKAELPAVSTGTILVKLLPIARESAAWWQRLDSLRYGQTRAEIEAILGRPTSIQMVEKSEGNQVKELVYPNPDASETLPPNKRKTLIRLDSDECFVSFFYTWLGC